MTKQQRLVLVVCILASFVAFLDGSVVNVGLPAIVRDLGGGLAVQQWVVDAYLITLGSLMLVAGSFSDLFGRKKVLAWGLGGFLVTSVLCAIAPSSDWLIGSRALQGVTGALLVPSSLAFIIGAFSGKAQGRAIGIWTSWTGIAFIVGPLLGGPSIWIDRTATFRLDKPTDSNCNNWRDACVRRFSVSRKTQQASYAAFSSCFERAILA